MKLVFANFFPFPPEYCEAIKVELEKEFPMVDFVLTTTDEDALREIVDADAVYGRLTPELLAAAKQLKWLQSPMANPPSGFFFPELTEHPVVVTNARGIYNDHIGVHLMAMLLGLARNLPLYAQQQAVGNAEPHREDTATVCLAESTLLIVGVGGIGQETGKYAAGFGMRVLGVDARLTEAPAGFEKVYPEDALDSLLPEADFVALTVPLTPETEGYFDAARIGRMKKGSFFLNVGRGGTAKLDALTDAVMSGHLAGAGLDVVEIEPLPEGHPFWKHPRVIYTPHVALVGPYLEERRNNILKENIRRLMRGELSLVNEVDKVRWF